MSARFALSLLALFALVAVGVRVAAAPALKDRPADHITGPLAVRMDSPVVLVRTDADESEQVVWLVFPRPELEAAALKDRPVGDRVTARGRLGWGGAFRYLVVSSIDAE